MLLDIMYINRLKTFFLFNSLINFSLKIAPGNSIQDIKNFFKLTTLVINIMRI